MGEFNSKTLKKIAVYTSGGDAPGMNAAIRSTVRTALDYGIKVYGAYHGYHGLLNNQFEELHAGSVANIIQRGGTLLKTGRCPDFLKPDFRKVAAENIRRQSVDGLICIGGDGSFAGAHALYLEHQIPVVGVPGTIDNDIAGTDFTIGFDTAANTAVEAVDRIRDTAAAHDRLFIVEVMGRNSGFLASEVGLAVGAEEIFTPENIVNVDKAILHIKKGIQRGKKSSILIAAEGQKPGRAYDLAESIRKKSGFDAKVCVLGHIQRGGSPTVFDRNLASRLGSGAFTALLSGFCDGYVGIHKNELVTCEFEYALKQKKVLPDSTLQLAKILSK